MAQEEQQAHKTNRDWHLDTSSIDSSNNNMNMDEDSETSATTRLTSNSNNDNNNHIVTRDDYDGTEDYEATDPDSFEAKIIDIASWTHDDFGSQHGARSANLHDLLGLALVPLVLLQQ
jgi:hypothetical protein